MKVRRNLLFLILIVCTIETISSSKNARGSPNVLSENRWSSLNEYLVPPPPSLSPSHLFPAGRTGRNVGPKPTEASGYFSNFMNWLNPFGTGSPQSLSPLPEASHSHASKFTQAYPPSGLPLGPPPKIYHGPSSSSHLHNQRSPLPELYPPNNYKLLSQPKGKHCNSCNKVPWIPIEHGGGSGNDYIENLRGAYLPPHDAEVPKFDALPPNNHGENHNSLHTYLPPINQAVDQVPEFAASHEIKTPNLFYAPLLPPPPTQLHGHVPQSDVLPDPHLAPLYTAKPFEHSSRSSPQKNNNFGYYDPPHHSAVESAPTPVLLPSNDAITNLNIAPSYTSDQLLFEKHKKSDFKFGVGESNDQIFNSQNDSFNSVSYDTQSTIDFRPDRLHVDTSNKQIYSESHTNRYIGLGVQENQGHDHQQENQQTDFSNLQRNEQGILPLGVTKNYYDFENPGSEYLDFGGSDIVAHSDYNIDQSSSGSSLKNSHVRTTDGLSNVEIPIHFEQSPLTDLTKTNDSQAEPPNVYSSQDVFVNLDNTSNAKTINDYDPRTNYLRVEEEINRLESLQNQRFPENNSFLAHSTKNTNKGNHFGVNENERKQFNEYIPYSTNRQNSKGVYANSFLQSGDSLLSISSTTLRSTNGGISLEQYEKDRTTLINQDSRQHGIKRNKQVQVIIPYTSQYTPIPFQTSHRNREASERTEPRKISYFDQSNRDNYVSQESRNELKVANPPLESTTLPGVTSTIEIGKTTEMSTTNTEVTTNSGIIKVNNTIDIHRLQKNIDNWTIQEYSRGTTSSTILPSSPRPYLLPSKKIPNEYLTTTESGDRTESTRSHEEIVKTFALAGFSFNDVEHEGPNRFDESRVQVIRVENPESGKESTKAADDVLNATTETTEVPWHGFSVSVSPTDKERVYVVTPQTATTILTANTAEQKRKALSKNTKKANEADSKVAKNKLDEFESIEKAYQVLPQAVNNLAVASTGPESVPLWGIMEHEEFASLSQEELDDQDDDTVVAPILYSGHSKVSRAKR